MTNLNDKYRIAGRLGGGGMAEVFSGYVLGAEGFARRVAIKRVLPGYSNNPQFAQMFIEEARLSAQLAHPNIVSVQDFDRDTTGRLFLVMELVDGASLHGLVAKGLLPYSVIIYVVAEILRGLGYAHTMQIGTSTLGIVHRDVSPQNVLLAWDGAVKVTDFGIAKARDATEASASVALKGKPAYMSPEQANGQSLDGRSDLFAVGVMLWELLTGRRLFAADDTRATIAAVLFGRIPRPRQLRAEVPKDLERVAMKLLERDLPSRYRSADDALVDLLDCASAKQSGRPMLSEILGARFHPARPSKSLPLPAVDAAQPFQVRRRRVLAVVSTVSIVVAVIALYFYAVPFRASGTAPDASAPVGDSKVASRNGALGQRRDTCSADCPCLVYVALRTIRRTREMPVRVRHVAVGLVRVSCGLAASSDRQRRRACGRERLPERARQVGHRIPQVPRRPSRTPRLNEHSSDTRRRTEGSVVGISKQERWNPRAVRHVYEGSREDLNVCRASTRASEESSVGVGPLAHDCGDLLGHP